MASGPGSPPPASRSKTPRPARAGPSPPTREAAGARPRNRNADTPELLLGRNPVLEALRAGVPSSALYVSLGVDADDRMTEAVRHAGDRGVPILEVGRAELDRMTAGALHQGIGLQ